MKKIFFLFCLFFALFSFSQKQIPDITISDFEGNNEKVHNLLSDDKLTIISLWATWCVPALRSLMQLMMFMNIGRRKSILIFLQLVLMIAGPKKERKRSLTENRGLTKYFLTKTRILKEL